MIVVSDTSPLNYLIVINQIDLLPKLFGQVVIPEAVLAELSHRGSPEAVRKWADAAPPWLTIRIVSPIQLPRNLGPGETEAISLAIELDAELLLLDDRKARNLARESGLKVAGLLNVLEAASILEFIDLPRVIARLRQTNFRAPAGIVKAMLQRHGQRQEAKGQQT
jgi:predicted nucleic acid-binding protein